MRLVVARTRRPRGVTAGVGGRRRRRPKKRNAALGMWSERSLPYVQCLLEYVAREGHARVPQDHHDGNLRLGGWVGNRRRDHRWGLLSAERTHFLERLPGWVWNVSQDRFDRTFRLLEIFVKREGHARVPRSHCESGYALGKWVWGYRSVYKAGRASGARASRLEALPGWTWAPHEEAFERGFSHLVRFVQREGHARVPQSHREGSYDLGAWVSGRRRLHSAGRLDPDKASALESLPGWSWNIPQHAFEEGLRKLRAFVKSEGHPRVARGHLEGGYPLGTWLASCRRFQRQGQLSRARAAQFEALPGWTWARAPAPAPSRGGFERGFSHLLTFVRREGHARVPGKHREGSYALGQWVGNCRRLHAAGRHHAGTASRLEALPGWSWNIRRDAFEEGIAKLRAFASREGDARVPKSHREGGFHLGLWVANRRKEHARGLLAPDTVKRLEALRGWSWHVFDDMFAEGFRQLRRFARREGHGRVPQRHVEEGFHLGRWLHALRKRKGTLTEERRRALEAIPDWSWHPLAETFERGLHHLRRFAAREGHSLVPQSHREDGFRLGAWVARCRKAHRAGRMSRDRGRALAALPGWCWEVRTAAFEEGLEHLRRFARRERHGRVPEGHMENGFRLGQWVRVVRRTRRKGSLTRERQRAVEAIPGWSWDPFGEAFETGLQRLKRFAAREGHARVPNKHRENGFNLGQWVGNRRAARKMRRLSRDQVRALEAVPGWRWVARSGPAKKQRGRTRG